MYASVLWMTSFRILINLVIRLLFFFFSVLEVSLLSLFFVVDD